MHQALGKQMEQKQKTIVKIFARLGGTIVFIAILGWFCLHLWDVVNKNGMMTAIINDPHFEVYRWMTYRFRLATDCVSPTVSHHRLLRGLPGYLILFDPHAFVPQRQSRIREMPSQSVF